MIKESVFIAELRSKFMNDHVRRRDFCCFQVLHRTLDALYKGLLISLVHGNNHAKLHKRDMLIRRVRHNNPVKSLSNSKIACDG